MLKIYFYDQTQILNRNTANQFQLQSLDCLAQLRKFHLKVKPTFYIFSHPNLEESSPGGVFNVTAKVSSISITKVKFTSFWSFCSFDVPSISTLA